MTERSCLSIILAAGEGTRMKSALPKVLHPIAGLPMVAHVARSAVAAGGADIALVVGNGAEAVEKAIGALLVVAGVLFVTGGVRTASYWLLETFPVLGQLG